MPLNANIILSGANPKTDITGAYAQGVQGAQQVKSNDITNKINELKLAQAKVSGIGQLLGQVKDPESYTAARNIAIQNGIASPEQIPEQYDPKQIEAWKNSAFTLKDKLDQAYKQAEIAYKMAGGSAGVLADRYGRDPDFAKNLYSVQTGFRQGTQIDPETGTVQPMAGAPGAKGTFKEAEEIGAAKGKKAGQVYTELGERKATMPQLEDTIDKLAELGKKATYTYGGQAADFLARQTGMEAPEGAIARREYISLVDNQILPLLRQTFGAQFTEKEGESLKNTLGDPNASPEEKEAVLRSFIDQKKQTINSLERESGQPITNWDTGEKVVLPNEVKPERISQPPKIGTEMDGYVYIGGDPANEKSWKKAR